MVKLVVSDIDGTLGPDGTSQISHRLIELIPRLKEKGILFAAASGRQLNSLKNLFREVEQDVIFIAENGAYVVCRDTEMSVKPMSRSLVEELTVDLRSYESKGAFLTASTPEALYVEHADEAFLDFLINGYKNETRIVEDILKLKQPIIKMSLYKEDGIFQHAQELVPKWNTKLKTVLAGSMWLDFMDLSTDKGNALLNIQTITGIKKEETICFGDNENDCSMFVCAGKAYAVENALPQVKEMADEIIDGYQKDGVIKVLEKLLEE